MNENIKLMLECKKWALYGATIDKNKFGYKIPLRLQKHGYDVYAINAKYVNENINGIKIYSSIEDIEDTIDCINVVVNPNTSLKVIDEAVKNNINNLWFQPGTWNEEVIKKAIENNLNIVYGECIYAILGE